MFDCCMMPCAFSLLPLSTRLCEAVEPVSSVSFLTLIVLNSLILIVHEAAPLLLVTLVQEASQGLVLVDRFVVLIGALVWVVLILLLYWALASLAMPAASLAL